MESDKTQNKVVTKDCETSSSQPWIWSFLPPIWNWRRACRGGHIKGTHNKSLSRILWRSWKLLKTVSWYVGETVRLSEFGFIVLRVIWMYWSPYDLQWGERGSFTEGSWAQLLKKWQVFILQQLILTDMSYRERSDSSRHVLNHLKRNHRHDKRLTTFLQVIPGAGTVWNTAMQPTKYKAWDHKFVYFAHKDII